MDFRVEASVTGEDAIATALAALAQDAGLRETLRRRGWCAPVSSVWRRSAEQLVVVFQSVIPADRKHVRLRKIQVTTTVGCKVACVFCPQKAFVQGYDRTGPALMPWETFTVAIDKLPSGVGVSLITACRFPTSGTSWPAS